MRRILRIGIGVWLGLSLIAAAVFTYPAFATAYGTSSYGKCVFVTGCPAQHTVVQTKSGLQVAINITDGQQIPDTGYKVEVTPLNGNGSSFQKVEFYIDGTLINTYYPDITGTATWQWDTKNQPGKTVKFVIYDTDGTPLTQQFNVSIVPANTAPAGSMGQNQGGGAPVLLPNTAGDNPVAQFWGFLQQTVRAIPVPVAISIPYGLLALLLLIIVLLYLQTQREVAEARRRSEALARARQLAEEKDGFIELASHYLRTPLTLIKGGVDYLGALQPPVDAAVLRGLADAADDFGASIESILMRISNDPRLKQIPSAPDVGRSRKVWTSPMFWLPVVIVGVVLATLNFLFVQSGRLDLSPMGLAAQFVLFAALAVALYIVLRRQELWARDHKRAQLQQEQQVAIDEARNQLIRDAASSLAQKLDGVQMWMGRLPDSDGKKFIQEGYNRISEVLRRFRATAMVVPPLTTMPLVRFTLSSMVVHAEKPVADAAAAKQITITGGTDDMELNSRQPAWLVQILTSVLDNAIAYSNPGSQVEVGCSLKQGMADLYVHDTGAGIAPEKLEELFQPFAKAEGAMQFDHPGIGLSLYLDRLLITNLGGSMHIDSSPGAGTTVHIIFPVH